MRFLTDGLQLGAFLILAIAIVALLMTIATATGFLLYAARRRSGAPAKASKVLSPTDPASDYGRVERPLRQTMRA